MPAKGFKHSYEARRKMSEAAKKDGRRPPSHKGVKASNETREKMSRSRKGIKFSAEWRKNMSEVRKGEKSHFWQGGITEENRKLRNSIEYRFWREEVYKRDNYTCVICGIPGGWSKEKKRKIELNADHIKRWALYPELRFEVSNGRTLCLDCHQKTDTFGRLSGETYNKWKLEHFRKKETAVNFQQSKIENIPGWNINEIRQAIL